MNKVLVGLGITAATAGIAFIVSKVCHKKKYATCEIASNPDSNEEQEEEMSIEEVLGIEEPEEPTFKEKLLAWVIIAFTWANNNKSNIEGAICIMGLIGGVFGLITEIKDFFKHDKIEKKLDLILSNQKKLMKKEVIA